MADDTARKNIRDKDDQPSAESCGRVLLAEDVTVNAEIIKQLLGKKNIITDHAKNGALAVELFKNSHLHAYDAILMDVRMPVMNGLEATKAIRSLEREDAKTVPVIALTANALEEDMRECSAAGMNAHLSKPVQPDVLFDVLKRWISYSAEEKKSCQLPEILRRIDGLDTAKGIEYCGDEEDYIVALKMFAGSVPKRADRIEESLNCEDPDEYITQVHSLKSTAGAVGAVVISEAAAKLERAGKSGDKEMIAAQTPVLLEMYRALGDELIKALGKDDN